MTRVVWLSPVLACVLGCGGTGDVSGAVTFKGEKLTVGTVTAVAANGSFQSPIDSDGNYEVKGLAVGKVKFYVHAQNPKMVEVSKEISGQAKDTGGNNKGGRSSISNLSSESKKVLAKSNLVPDRYSDQTKELLVFDVVSGKNEYPIKLDP